MGEYTLKNQFVSTFRIILFLLSTLALTVATVAFLEFILPGHYANMFLGRHIRTYPITFQTVMWFPFSMAIMITIQRWYYYNENMKDLDNPSYNLVNLLADSMSELEISHQAFKQLAQDRLYIYPRVFASGLEAMLESSRFSDVKEEIEVSIGYLHTELDATYNRIKYISWLLPTIGFVNTVYGISVAVGFFNTISADDPKFLPTVAAELSLAFDTTVLALIQSAFTVLIFTHLEGLENKLIARVSLNAQSKCRRILRHLARAKATYNKSA